MSVLDTDLYCLTAEEFSCGRGNIDVVKEMINSGIKLIQYREKEKNILDKYSECLEIRRLTKDAGVTFIVNDHVDLAMAVGADGLHVGQDDLPISVIREITGGKIFIGLSTHSPEQAQKAVKDGVDYIGVGPVFKTYTKKDVCDPVGFEYLEYIVKNIDLPFVAIGGIKEDNVKEIVKRGAKCVAMVTEIIGADNIGSKINSIRKQMSI